LCAPVPTNGFGPVLTSAFTIIVTGRDFVQCLRLSLGGSKLVQPQRFSEVLGDAEAIEVHVTQSELRLIKCLRCS
jgi:hypothetical protein